MDTEFTECCRCGKVINYGSAYVSIVRNVEQAEFDLVTNDVEIEVFNSDEIISLCGTCGNSFDTDAIANIIKVIPTDRKKYINN